MKTIEQYKTDILLEIEATEALAFEMYCKSELGAMMGRCAKANETKDEVDGLLAEMTIEYLTKQFNTYNYQLLETPKQSILKRMQKDAK